MENRLTKLDRQTALPATLLLMLLVSPVLVDMWTSNTFFTGSMELMLVIVTAVFLLFRNWFGRSSTKYGQWLRRVVSDFCFFVFANILGAFVKAQYTI
jgi:hypothetical protein